MKIEEIDFKLLISKKENAEAYKDGIDDLQKEINDIKSRIDLSMIAEEKNILNKEKEQKTIELETLRVSYQQKRENIEYEINNVKQSLLEHIEETESKLISKEEHDKLNEEKINKEAELLECENDIKEVKEELKSLIDKDNGYEQDTVTLSKKLDNLTAYKAYIKEEIEEINGKLTDKFIIEENLEEIKYIKNMKIRLADLSYDTIENWVEKEQEFYSEIKGENEISKVDPTKVGPAKVGSTKVDPAKVGSTKVDPAKVGPTKVGSTKVDPAKVGSTKVDPAKVGPTKVEATKVDPTKAKSEKTEPKEIDSVIQKYTNDGYQKNVLGWYFNPWTSEYDKEYDPHNDKEYNKELNISDTKGKDTGKEDTNKENKKVIYEISEIKVEPWKHQIEVVLANGSKIQGSTSVEYRNENDKISEILKNSKEVLGEEYNIDKNSKKLDPNILILLNDTKNEEFLHKYIKAICSKNKDELPFKIGYDLEGTSYLDKEERKNIKKIARSAKKLGADINKEKLSNKIKALFISSKQLLLSEKNATNELQNENKEKYVPKHDKPRTKIVEKLKARLPKREQNSNNEKRPNVISKAKSIATSIGRKTIGGLKIVGTRISGHFKGENSSKTENKVRANREKSFVSKAKVDESLALENVEKNAEENIKSKETAGFIIE